MPTQLRGYPRVDALQAFGPFQLRSSWQSVEAATLREQLDAHDAAVQEPPLDPPHQQELWTSLAALTCQWFGQFCTDGHVVTADNDLQDIWLHRLAQEPDALHGSALRCFAAWGRADLPDIYADFVDGEAEVIVDEAFAALLHDVMFLQRSCMMKAFFGVSVS